MYYFTLQIAEKGYRRLTPDQSVGLRHAGYVIKVEDVKKVRLKLSCLCYNFIHVQPVVRFM